MVWRSAWVPVTRSQGQGSSAFSRHGTWSGARHWSRSLGHRAKAHLLLPSRSKQMQARERGRTERKEEEGERKDDAEPQTPACWSPPLCACRQREGRGRKREGRVGRWWKLGFGGGAPWSGHGEVDRRSASVPAGNGAASRAERCSARSNAGARPATSISDERCSGWRRFRFRRRRPTWRQGRGAPALGLGGGGFGSSWLRRARPILKL